MVQTNSAKVCVFHYSNSGSYKVALLDVKDDAVRFKLPEKYPIHYFHRGDPLVLQLVNGKEVNIIGSDVMEIFEASSIIEVKVDIKEDNARNRLYERCPVSLYADIKNLETNKTFSALVKDVSRNGLLVYCEEKLNTDTELRIGVYLDEVTVFFNAVAVRVVHMPYSWAYGLSIPSLDLISRNNIYKCLRTCYDQYQEKIESSLKLSVSFDEFELARVHFENMEEHRLNLTVKKLDELIRRSKV